VRYTSVEFGDGQARYSGGDFGLSAGFRPVGSFLISAALQGITFDRVYDNDDTDPIVEGAVAWSSRSDVSLGALWTRQRNGDHRFALGQILPLGGNLDFLAGLRFDPVRYSLGGKATYSGMSLCYAYEGHPDLGGTHSFGFSWSR
jgi:hypothetical protein